MDLDTADESVNKLGGELFDIRLLPNGFEEKTKMGNPTSYLRNAQGDIVKLIDGSGSTVVEYVYDSWGKVLSTTGTLATTVGIEQPFRYRGYVYDRETQWYYLQSR